eukprot:1162059-Pelagomonas_calceolata.AAC.15
MCWLCCVAWGAARKAMKQLVSCLMRGTGGNDACVRSPGEQKSTSTSCARASSATAPTGNSRPSSKKVQGGTRRMNKKEASPGKDTEETPSTRLGLERRHMQGRAAVCQPKGAQSQPLSPHFTPPDPSQNLVLKLNLITTQELPWVHAMFVPKQAVGKPGSGKTQNRERM